MIYSEETTGRTAKTEIIGTEMTGAIEKSEKTDRETEAMLPQHRARHHLLVIGTVVRPHRLDVVESRRL